MEYEDVELGEYGGIRVADSKVGEFEAGTTASVEDISNCTKCSIIAKLR